MDEIDRGRFALAMGRLCVTFGQDASNPLLRAYWAALSDLAIDDLEQAIHRATQECEFMPKPAQLREYAQGATDQRALGAWHAANQAAGLGPNKTIDFADQTINAAVRHLGGWPRFLELFLCGTNENWSRKEFLATYKSLSKCKLSDDAYRPLPGLARASVCEGKLVSPVIHRIGADGSLQARLAAPSVGGYLVNRVDPTSRELADNLPRIAQDEDDRRREQSAKLRERMANVDTPALRAQFLSFLPQDNAQPGGASCDTH